MKAWHDFIQNQTAGGAIACAHDRWPGIARFSELDTEYRGLASGPALVDRSYRGLLEIRGADRASFVHNFTTNQVTPLRPNAGVYAFALSASGRIIFDLNILIREDSIWVDLDRRFLERARAYFDKYTFTEDVLTTDRSDDFVRLGLAGDKSVVLLAGFGAMHAPAMAPLATTNIQCGGTEMTLLRHDFCGQFGVELFVPAGRSVEVWGQLIAGGDAAPALPVGDDAVQVRRIEAGLPWPGSEINDEVLPAETGQLQRAVSFNKGCYLGQEVVERMRSRGVVARHLVGLLLDGEDVPPVGATFTAKEDQTVGKLTSACRSFDRGSTIGLGYVKSTHAAAGTAVRVTWDAGSTEAAVAKLPFTAGRGD